MCVCLCVLLRDYIYIYTAISAYRQNTESEFDPDELQCGCL